MNFKISSLLALAAIVVAQQQSCCLNDNYTGNLNEACSGTPPLGDGACYNGFQISCNEGANLGPNSEISVYLEASPHGAQGRSHASPRTFNNSAV
jgi:hypothetical protein